LHWVLYLWLSCNYATKLPKKSFYHSKCDILSEKNKNECGSQNECWSCNEHVLQNECVPGISISLGMSVCPGMSKEVLEWACAPKYECAWNEEGAGARTEAAVQFKPTAFWEAFQSCFSQIKCHIWNDKNFSLAV
jgi:hypothetical protein